MVWRLKGARPMGLSCLINLQNPIVIDASVAINLNGTGNAEGILSALPHRVLVTDVVFDELRADSKSIRNDGNQMEALIERGIVKLTEIGKLQGVVFETLVVGSGSNTIDD